MKDSPLTRANRPLPHEFKEFVDNLESFTKDLDPGDYPNYHKILNWLKELSK